MVWRSSRRGGYLVRVEPLCMEVAVIVGSWFSVGQVVSHFSRASALPPPMASSSDGCTEGHQSEKNDRFCKRQKRHSSLSFIELFYNWARNSHFCTLLCHTVSPWPMDVGTDAVAL